jgi:iron complex transport system permease protein
MTMSSSIADHHFRARRQTDLWGLGLFVVLIVLMLASLTIGRYPVPFSEVVKIVFTTNPINAVGSYSNKEWVVVEIIRMPRVLLVTICGMGLALSGAAMQGVFRNPLVGPEIAGVTSGASLGGVIAIVLGWNAYAMVALAFGSGVLALFFAFGLAVVAGRSSTLALILSGVIVGGFCSSLLGLIQTMVDPTTKLPSIIFWLLGSFVGATYEKVAIVSTVTLIAGGLVLALRWRINLLSLGENDARALGLNVKVLRWVLMALVAMIVAAQVSVSGGVGWVGLIVPHIARLLVGPDHSRLLPTSAVLGGIYLLAMDDIARTATHQEIPIGLLTSAIGTPVFAFLFWKIQSKAWTQE